MCMCKANFKNEDREIFFIPLYLATTSKYYWWCIGVVHQYLAGVFGRYAATVHQYSSIVHMLSAAGLRLHDRSLKKKHGEL